jgi:hypothetical protein
VDVNAVHNDKSPNTSTDDPTFDCLTGRYVYDKLPCTIGNGLEIAAGLWQVKDPANWYIYKSNLDYGTAGWAPNGPVREIGTYTPEYSAARFAGAQYVIEKSGKITVSVTATIWERVDTTCSYGRAVLGRQVDERLLPYL